jgi:hypothetical protein
LPFVHRPEQHVIGAAPSGVLDVPLAVQGFPAVRHAVVSGWQWLPEQFWLQHSVDVAQVWLSAVQLTAVEQT